MMQRRVLAVGALLLGALLLIAIPVSAHERTLTVTVGGTDSVEIRSETLADGSEVDFRFRASAPNSSGGWPKLGVGVERETGAPSAEEIEVEFRAAFRGVFEFSDANGNGVQDPAEASLSSVRLDALTFAPIAVADHVANSVDGHRVTIRGTQGGFSFGLVSYIFPSQAQVSGNLVPEQAVKVDIMLEGYAFTSSTSLLGLEIAAESSVEQRPDMRDGTESTEVTVSRGTAFFRWDPQAQVDGQTVPVSSEWEADGDRLFLYYPHGTVIVHDPLIGFELASPLLLILVVASVVTAVAVALGVVVLRRRRRGRGPRPSP